MLSSFYIAFSHLIDKIYSVFSPSSQQEFVSVFIGVILDMFNKLIFVEKLLRYLGIQRNLIYPNKLERFVSRITLSHWIKSRLFSIRTNFFRRLSDNNYASVDLICMSPHGTTILNDQDVALVFLTHNSQRFLKSFLKHYRALGVTRFICVDDVSTDGTIKLLLEQPDVDLYRSNVRYRDARRGRLWREKLFELYGQRWYLNLDSDEYLVYADFENRSLAELISVLKDLGLTRCPAPMLDCYPDKELQLADFLGVDDRMPWEVAPLIDGSGYFLRFRDKVLSIKGGVRSRLFGLNNELIKYPIIYWEEGTSLGDTIHHPLPYRENFYPALGALLHFKFFSDTDKFIENAIQEKQYHGNSASYRVLGEKINSLPRLNFVCEKSFAYNGSSDLVKRGFMLSPFEAIKRSRK